MLARRGRVPYSIGLIVAGFGMALLPFAPHIQLTRELIFTAFLPPLIFEAALYLHWRELRKRSPSDSCPRDAVCGSHGAGLVCFGVSDPMAHAVGYRSFCRSAAPSHVVNFGVLRFAAK
jgi:hypothetical protein